MTEKDAVLSANLEFYRAFTTRDIDAMEALWARTVPVSCIHPGWAPLRERDAVIASWRNILANPDAPRLMCHDDDAVVYGTIAIVTCEEDLTGNTLAATNIFVREDGIWRIIHHQAGPLVTQQGRGDRRPRTGRLH
jgi:hypothetical protein